MAIVDTPRQLVQLAPTEVKSRRRKYLNEAQKHVSTFPGWEQLSRRDQLALSRYVYKSAGKEAGNRKFPPIKELEILDINKGSEELLRATSCLTAAFTPKAIINDLMQGTVPSHHPDVFQDDDRLYFELVPSAQPLRIEGTQLHIQEYLASRGYVVSDYRAGYCTDQTGKQKYKIGRLLKDVPELAKAFEKDKSRGGDDLLVVISRHPYDIARMSTGRGWSSCMAKTGSNYRFVAHDIAAGSVVSYLVRRNDTNIEDPLSRQMLKPYRSDEGETILVPQQVYGLEHGAFEETNAHICQQLFNHGRLGAFNMDPSLYVDGVSPHCEIEADGTMLMSERGARALPQRLRDGTGTARELFHYLAWRYTVETQENGPDLLVLDDEQFDYEVYLPALGLIRLPAGFEHVRSRHGFNLRDNDLVSLEGLPPTITDLNVAGNQLPTLEDVPPGIKRIFAKQNPIVTLRGLPEGLEELNVGETLITDLAGTPASIQELDLDGCLALASLKDAPASLKKLVLDNTGFTRLDDIPRVDELRCRFNGLTDLRGLPDGIGSINVRGNSINTLEGMPSGVAALDVEENQLVSLRGACEGLKRIVANGNALETSAGAPNSVAYLDLSENSSLHTLEALPLSLKKLVLQNHSLESLEGIPNGCEVVEYKRYEYSPDRE